MGVNCQGQTYCYKPKAKTDSTAYVFDIKLPTASAYENTDHICIPSVLQNKIYSVYNILYEYK